MSTTIEISDALFARLESHVSGFSTPEKVIKMLLDYYESSPSPPDLPPTPKSVPTAPIPTARRDYTKYMFNGVKYGKGKLVLAVVTAYANEHLNKSFDEFLKVFPKRIQGSQGVFDTPENARKRLTDPEHRFFMGPGEPIQLLDCEVVVCSQWGKSKTDRFIAKAKKLGYTITPFE